MAVLPDSLHPDLKTIQASIYEVCGLKLIDPKVNVESAEYGACSFILAGKKIEHRVSKITPTKIGQFVTIWLRSKEGITRPFDVSDEIDFVIITSRSGNNIGQFVFPQSILLEQGIISDIGKEGKRGIRVYPPWDIVPNKQVEKTRNWQIKYFFQFTDKQKQEGERFKQLVTG